MAKMMKKMSAMKAMKSMKTMKAKKAMKSMRRMKAKKVSKRTAVRQVFAGKKNRTNGGLKKDALTKNKNGKIVSKKASLRGKKNKWTAATQKARAALKIKGFCAVGGKTAQGKALLAKARSFYKK